MQELTPEQEKIVEQELTAFTQDEIGAGLGLARQQNGAWSDKDAERIIAEIADR